MMKVYIDILARTAVKKIVEYLLIHYKCTIEYKSAIRVSFFRGKHSTTYGTMRQ